MTLFKIVNGESVPLDEDDLRQRALDEEAHQAMLILMNSWQKKREAEYQIKIDPFLLTAISEHYLDGDSSKLDSLKQIKSEIKARHPKQ